MTDALVVGAGPVGLACAIELKRAGLRAVVVDKGALVNSFLGYPTNMEFFSTPELLEIGEHPFSTNRYKPLREEAIDYYRRVALAEQLDTRLYTRVTGIEGARGDFRVTLRSERTGQTSVLSVAYVVVATGFFDFPNRMDVPGEDLPHVTHYYKEPFAYAGQRVVVIGAKNSAAKAALGCHRNGAKVTLVVRGAEISDRVKYWLRPDLENRIAEGAIKAHFNARVLEITPEAVRIETPAGSVAVSADFVLAMTGYRPDYDFLRDIGIDIGSDPAQTPHYEPESFETNRRGVYLAGTVCGGLRTGRWFIENGRHHAQSIAQHMRAQGTVSSQPPGSG